MFLDGLEIMGQKTKNKGQTPTKNFWLKAGICTAAAACLGVGVLYEQFRTPTHDTSNPAINVASRSEPNSLEKITFEEAKKAVVERSSNEEQIVQAYFDQLLRERDKHDLGIDGWDSFRRFIYDPNLEKMYAEYEKRGLKPRPSNKAYQKPGGNVIASVPRFKIGSPCGVYISRHALKFAKNQDELLSILDNEAFHAGLYHKGKSHMSLGIRKLSDTELSAILDEILSFDLQFGAIALGLRRVSNEFIYSSYKGARVLFKELEKIAEERTPRSYNAKVIYNSLLQRPTFQFFVTKNERKSKRPYKLSR